MDRLTLEVRDYAGPHRWRWVLSEVDGGPIADHEVELDTGDPWCEAFARLRRYLGLHIDPARPLSSEAEIVDGAGRWIGQRVFGPVGDELVRRAPVTVEVRFPAEATGLMFRPWELAVVDDLPLACQDVSLVMSPPTVSARGKDPVGGRLRMLGVFSLPDGAPSLLLREQRRALVRLVDRIRTRGAKAIDLSVLQYDVTRDRLRDMLEDGDGWDIVHFSGHGLVDGLVLEGTEGTQDTVPTAELIRLLRAGRGRLKLLVLSSCNSAAAPPGEILGARFGADTVPVLAERAAGQLDCAVLAMRYAVDDDFSIALAEQLYTAMLASGQPLTRALQLALPKALGDRPRPGTPPLSAGIPALFGRRCLDLALSPPAAPPATFPTGDLRMAHFGDEPDHLVGRAGVLGSGARLLSDDSPAGIMFTGATGLGKTTCAVELAYRHERVFGALARYDVPAEGAIGSLPDFARALDRQLPGLELASQVVTVAKLTAFLPVLTELVERFAILILIDGIDGLLTAEGYWRDPSWGAVITALLSHRGFSRLMLTGRQPPKVVPAGLVIERLEPLTPRESVLLARQLPTLGALIRGTSPVPIAAARRLLADALTTAAGNPDAIERRDLELSGADLSQVAPAGVPGEEYVALIDRWTYELS
jgi:CHAT domain